MRRLIFFLVLTTPLHAVDQTAKLSEFAMGLYAERDGDTDSARQHFEATLEADPDAFFLARKTSATQLALEDLAAGECVDTPSLFFNLLLRDICSKK